jgi:hypothetical protein
MASNKPTPPPRRRPPLIRGDRAVSILAKLLDDGQELYAYFDPGIDLSRTERFPCFPNNVEEWRSNAQHALHLIFGETHENSLRFTKAANGSFYSSLEYHEQLFRSQIDGMLRVLKSGMQQIQWRLPPTESQVFFQAGRQHDAFVEIRTLVSDALDTLTIVDSYVDQTLWSLLTNVRSTVTIQILTRHMKGDFTLEGKTFGGQHKNRVEVRLTQAIHDRFIITDKGCWHLGASINHAGSKSFLLSQIMGPKTVQGVLADITDVWNSASPVAI